MAERWSFRLIAVAYVFFLVAWPVSLVVQNTFQDGTTMNWGVPLS